MSELVERVQKNTSQRQFTLISAEDAKALAESDQYGVLVQITGIASGLSFRESHNSERPKPGITDFSPTDARNVFSYILKDETGMIPVEGSAPVRSNLVYSYINSSWQMQKPVTVRGVLKRNYETKGPAIVMSSIEAEGLETIVVEQRIHSVPYQGHERRHHVA